MNLGEETKCNQCLEVFSKTKKPLRMPNCKHNICEQCLSEIKSSTINIIQCQFCHNSINNCRNKKFELNRDLMKTIKTHAKRAGNNSDTANSIDGSFKIQSSSFNQDDGDLLLGEENLPFNKRSEMEGSGIPVGLCVLHEKPLEIICINDKKTICPHCAIFGDHKDHKFKTLIQFRKDYENNCETLQIIKQQKYICDKKYSIADLNEKIKALIGVKKEELNQVIVMKYEKLICELKENQQNLLKELERVFEEIEKETIVLIGQQGKIEEEFANWQSNWENILISIEEQTNLSEKIRLMYYSQKPDRGYELVERIDQRHQAKMKKIQSLISSIAVDFLSYDLKSFATIRKSNEFNKDTFISMLEKINIPSGKHTLEIQDFDDNSFICNYSREDFSLMLVEESKKATPRKKKESTLQIKMASPPKKIPEKNKLFRSTSNDNPKVKTLLSSPNKMPKISNTIKKDSQSQITEMLGPDAVVEQFLKQDLREVLDLSRCGLNDENVTKYLSPVRSQRKIRGLKLCQNEISDAGFDKIIDLLGSTSNLNLSYNLMTEQVLSLILSNRDKLSPLRIVNLSFNKINEKRAKTRLEALKKIGIIVKT